MSHRNEIMTAIGTLAIAVAIGFVMQSSETAKERYGARAHQDDASALPVSVGAQDASALGHAEYQFLEMQGIVLTAAVQSPEMPDFDSAPELKLASAPALAMPSPEPSDRVPAMSCNIKADLAPRPAGMVSVVLTAPCLPDSPLTVHHSKMMFSAATDSDGVMRATVPVIESPAVFIFIFDNGDGVVAQSKVEGLEKLDRTVVQWRGSAGLALHAREFGAEYGSAGHVWSGRAQDVSATALGETGYIIRLGDTGENEALIAEVYTFASSESRRSGQISLSVEAEITADNCNREVAAQTVERSRDGVIRSRDLSLAVPDCDAVGSILVLNNLVSDLKVASN